MLKKAKFVENGKEEGFVFCKRVKVEVVGGFFVLNFDSFSGFFESLILFIKIEIFFKEFWE